MIRNRRHALIGLGAALTLGALLPTATRAQEPFPSQPVKVIVGFPPGSATDVAARAVCNGMAPLLGQPCIVENKAGAASNIAARAVATSPADGYTLFAATSANAINAAFPQSRFVDIAKEFVPITMIGSVPNVLVVHPSLGMTSVADLIRLAKDRPGAVTYASSGIGTSPHLSGELFSSMSGVKMVHVPYRGSTPAVTDLLAGQVQVMFSPASSVLQHVHAGKLKALATTGAQRTAAAPDLPTLDELGLKGFETAVWFGLVAPAGTPASATSRIRAAAHAALGTPEVRALFAAQGIDIVESDGAEFSRHIARETAKWSRVIQAAGIKPD
jgi:tripartite-type tricarboxylate transporter receptor subunit TctC